MAGSAILTGRFPPRDNPMCNDAIMDAGFANGTTHDVPGPGLSYMLAGGSDQQH